MARLPHSLAQWAGLPSPNPTSATSATLAAPSRLTRILQQSFPVGQAPPSLSNPAVTPNASFGEANNPRIAPYAARPPVAALSADTHRQPSATQQSAGTAVSHQLSQQLQPGRDASCHQHRQAGQHATFYGHARKPGANRKQSRLHSAAVRRPKSASLSNEAKMQAPAAVEGLNKRKVRARSVSPNSQYQFSSTSSVPDDAAAWIAATASLGSRQACPVVLMEALCKQSDLKALLFKIHL